MISMVRKIIVSVILFLIAIMPIIESINGYLNGKGVSNVYRFITIFFIAIYLILFNKVISANMIALLYLITIFLFIILIQFIFFYNNQNILIDEIKSILRFFLCPIYFVFFSEAILNNDVEKKTIDKIILLYSFLFGSILFGLYIFKFGFVSYDFEANELTSFVSDTKGLGFKGFFIELNSLVAILSACLFFMKDEILKNMESKRTVIIYLSIYMLLIFALFITATKFGIVISYIFSMIFIVQILKKSLSKKRKIGILVAVVFILLLLKFFFGNLFYDVFDRLSYFFSTTKGNSLDVLFSNRISYLFEIINSIDNSQNSIFISIFGKGFNTSLFDTGSERSIVEIDIFDLCFSYGIIGTYSYFYFFKDSFCQLFISKFNSIKNMILILYIYSFLGGHIIFNSMTATFLAICLSYVSTTSKTVEQQRLDYDFSNF